MAYVGERHGHETCLLGAYSLVRKYNKGMTDTVKSLLTAIPRLAFFFFFFAQFYSLANTFPDSLAARNGQLT